MSREETRRANIRAKLDGARAAGTLIDTMLELRPSDRLMATEIDIDFYEANRPRTESEWRKAGYKPHPDAKPAKTINFVLYGRPAHANYYYEEQVVEVRKPVPAVIDQTPENVAAAVFAVNRAAKRRRDAAFATYMKDNHSFAAHHSAEKQELYRLKDVGIAWLATEGHMIASRIHGSLAVWEGLSYRFHSRLVQKGAKLLRDEVTTFRAEAKPAGSNEMRIVDAKGLLSRLPDLKERFGLLPPVANKQHADELDEDEMEFDDDEIETTPAIAARP